MPKASISVAGVSVFMAGFSFLGFEWKELFRGEKPQIFWWGLTIFGFALSSLFAILWYGFAGEYGIYMWQLFIPYAFGSMIFLLIGLYMMKSGVGSKLGTQTCPFSSH